MICNERIHFRLFMLDCCGHMLCWVNPRFPNYCPECGTYVYPGVKGQVTMSDDNAHIKFKSEEL